MSISSEHKHEAVAADLGRVAISSCWLNALNNSEVGGVNAWGLAHALKGSALASHGVVHGGSSKLSPSHLLEVGLERLVGVLDDETVLHGD